MITLLIVIGLLALVFGGYGHTRGEWGPWGWSPLGVVLLIVLFLWLTGAL